MLKSWESDGNQVLLEGLVTELVEALRRNEWVARGHDPEPSCPECTRWQSRGHIKMCSIGRAIARATPEAVRQADAAPEMYEALVRIRAGVDIKLPWDETMYRNDIWHLAETALAKAEGKP